MNKSLKWKVALLILLIGYAGATLFPSLYTKMKGADYIDNIKLNPNLTWTERYLTSPGLQEGLDLQGGMHIVLKVDLDKAVENALNFSTNHLKEQLKEQQLTVVKMPSGDPHTVLFTLPNKSGLAPVEAVIKEDYTDIDIEVKETGDFPRIFLTLKQDRIDFINDKAVDQALEIIRNRIDQFGVSEPVIVRQGADEVIVQLPGVKNKSKAKDLLGSTAMLEFMLVDGPATRLIAPMVAEAKEAGTFTDGQNRSIINDLLRHQLPEDTSIYFEKEVEAETGLVTFTPLVLKNQILMTGEAIADAQVSIGGNFNEPYVSLELTGTGTKMFSKITGDHINERLAIVLDGNVRSAPNINSKIRGGSAMIEGNFTFEDATSLAIVLRVGALPAPVDIVQEMTVGASLGHDSITQGINSGLFGTAMVFLFMIVYYRLSGVIANVALLLNILFVFTGLAALQATLTLPGIAGIVLSIGMAVDSNVLIFERMREEFGLGKSPYAGVKGGYDMAFWTIVDSQVTTLITAMALFLFGTGPIKGFAVTLSLGVTFNLFTTLFATRLIYDIMYEKRLLKPIKFFEAFQRPNLDFMALSKLTFTISGVLVLIGLFSGVQLMRGNGNLGVDFAGGAMLQYKADKSFDMTDIRSVLKDYDLQPVPSENRLIVKIKKSSEIVGTEAEIVSDLMKNELGQYNWVLESQSEIGSSVSSSLRDKALQAIFISLLGVILYLAMRFDIRFGVAAALATFHDVIVVLGICYLLNIEITLLIVTALLTLAGYSLNDSVVVFDRIRENMRKEDAPDFRTTINLSVNQVMSRTFVTSLTSAMVMIALFVMGGTVIHDFSFALLAGIIVGTYSSVFIASPILYIWRKN